MGKILVKAPRQQTMVDSQGNVQFMYGGGEGRKSTIPARLAAYLGKIAGGALGAAGNHKSLMSLIGGIQGGAATGEQAGRSLIDSNPVTIGYRALIDRLNRPKKRTPQQVYADEKKIERRRQMIRRDVRRELARQDSKNPYEEAAETTRGTVGDVVRGTVGVKGQRVENPTNLSAAALTPTPRLETPETTVTNPGPAADNKTGVAAGHEPVTPDLAIKPNEQGRYPTAEEIKQMIMEENAQKGGQQFGQASQLPPPEVPA